MTKTTTDKLIEVFEWQDKCDNKSLLTEENKNAISEIIINRLVEIFKVDKKEQFTKKFKEACSGDGDEINKITTAYSSSLCALLFFYNVSDKNKNPLILKINSKEIIFRDVLFEFQNTVIEIEGRKSKPSNVDIVLLGEIKEEKKKVILFLESKFSEYLSNGNTTISESYLDETLCPIGYKIYNNELSKLGIEFKKDKGKKDTEYTLQSKDKEKYYIHGIKQMISHYIGIDNLLNGNLCESNTEKLKELYTFLSGNDNKNYNEEELKEMLNDDNTKIYLGEIMFDFYKIFYPNEIQKKEYDKYFKCFYNYNKKYEELAEILNKLEEKEDKSRKKINILPQLLTYSLFKDNKTEHKIEDKIKQYYKLNLNK